MLESRNSRPVSPPFVELIAGPGDLAVGAEISRMFHVLEPRSVGPFIAVRVSKSIRHEFAQESRDGLLLIEREALEASKERPRNSQRDVLILDVNLSFHVNKCTTFLRVIKLLWHMDILSPSPSQRWGHLPC
jgi:hypothetical protein